MPRKKGMIGGPGAGVMGGAGAKPRMPPTAMAGRPSPAAPAGMPGPIPGGQPRGGGLGGGGGMGGAAGFKKGGHAEKHEGEKSERKKYERGGDVEKGGPKREAFAKGGFVGGDAKGRTGRDTGHAGKSS